MIKKFNNRASMLANPTCYTRVSSEAKKTEFDTVLAFFGYINRASRYGVVVGKVTGLPATVVWASRQIKLIQYLLISTSHYLLLWTAQDDSCKVLSSDLSCLIDLCCELCAWALFEGFRGEVCLVSSTCVVSY